MPTVKHRVGLVVDRALGERIEELATLFHVWVVESPVNNPAIKRVREAGGPDPSTEPQGTGVTSCHAAHTESTEDMAARIAADVDEHHSEFSHDPPWSEIAVFGAPLTERLRDLFMQLGATAFDSTADGFVARR